MKKLIFTITIIICFTLSSIAQWTDGGTNVYLNTSTDLVGIGTSSPTSKLTVVGNASFTSNLAIGATFSSNKLGVAGAMAIGSTYAASFGPIAPANGLMVEGNVGIGTTTPDAKLSIQHGSTAHGSNDDGKILYVTGLMGSGQTFDGGIEFRHDNQTAGIGFGYNSIYASGNTSNQELNIFAKGSGTLSLNAYGGGTGNVGIGTISPSQKLEVNGIININADNAPAGNGLAFGDYPTGGYKWIQSFESQNLAINPLGNNVGIGTTSPLEKLHIVGDLLIGSDAISTANFTGLKFQYNAADGEGAIMSSYDDGQGFLTFYTKAGPGLPVTEKMRIDKIGNVGIGTTLPMAKLDIRNNNKFSLIATGLVDNLYLQDFSSGEGLDSIGASISFTGPGNGGGQAPRRHAAIAAVQSHPTETDFIGLSFYTHNLPTSTQNMQESMRLTHDGKLGINTSSPTQTLDVNGKVRIRNLALNNTKDSVLVASGDGTLAYRTDLSDLESDPLFAVSVSAGITGIDTSNWNNKLEVETDPLFGASVAAGITGIDTSNWNNKLDVENDPEVGSNTLNSIPKWDGTALVSGSISDVLGNIGIGTSGPSQKLDINGKLRIRDLILDNSKDSLLVASGNGTLSFRSATSLTGSGFWGALGNDISNNNTGYVGIGTVTPTQKLDVNGKVRIRDLVLDNTKDSVLVASGDGTVAYRDVSGLIDAGTGLTKSGNSINAIGSTTIIANANNLEVNSSGTANQVLLSSGSIGFSASFGSVPLGDNNAVTGTLNVANGGTGATSLTSGNFLQGAGGSAIISTKAVPAGDVVGTIDTQTLRNKTLTDASTYLADNADLTKIVQFQLSGITTTTTRTVTVPDADMTLVGTDVTQALTNKTINTAFNTITVDAADVTTGTFNDARISESNVTQHESAITLANLVGAPSSSVVGINDTQILTNKTLIDASTYLADNADFTKKVQFQLSDIITGTTRTLTVPDANTTLVGTDVTQILTNKTINTSSNTITVDAADVTTGTFNDARISESNVTQHESALTITESQISDLSHFTAGDETDPEVGANTTNRVSIWDGSALVSGIITDDGNSVGIGTDSLATGYLLSVDGRIICEELQILPSGSWPDYVFNKEYDLWSLEEVEKYIEMNNHLPGIPSAKCVEEDGISVGEMSKLLLEKMEELMLHVIEQSKQNAEQSKQLIDQAIKIKDLQKINVALLNKLN